MTYPADILIVDDQDDIRLQIRGILEDEAYVTCEAKTSQEAEALVTKKKPDLVILDLWLDENESDGLNLLKKLIRIHSDLPILIISGHGTIETAVNAIRLGAYDFLEKPFKADKLLVLVARALEAARLRKENQELRLRSTGAVSELTGCSQSIQNVAQMIQRVAPTNSRVLITGEAGVGKDLVARLIHMHSKRSQNNYMVLNCAILAANRIETELFGVEGRGQGHISGVLEQANGGTLFLDEIADMPLETQAKIVRVLQDQHFTRLGGTQRVEVDIRILAATNQSLQDLMIAGKFRQDLYYRLSVVPLQIPALRERLEDIPLLAEEFMAQASKNVNSTSRVFAPDAMALMQAYEWPGNIRQLRNVIEWLVIMASGDEKEPITADMLPPDLKQKALDMVHGSEVVELMSKPLREAREIFEREYLLSQVNRFGGNISRTAGFIGMERSALHRKLKALGVHGADKGELDQVAEG